MNINPLYSAFYNVSTKPDEEHMRIIRKLYFKYGIRSSGSKSADIAKLHGLELKEAEQDNSVSTKFLTVTKNEQEKIQKKKQQKRINNEPKEYNSDGAKLLGEQIYLAIKIRNNLNKNSKLKRNKS